MDPIRAVHVIVGLGTGGAEKMLVNLLSRRDPDRFRHTVITLTSDLRLRPEVQKLAIPVHGFSMDPRFPSPATMARVIRLIRDCRPDLVQGWMIHGILAAQSAKLFLAGRIPVVWTIQHSLDDLSTENGRTGWLIRFSARLSSRPACIVYNSRRSARQHEAIGYDAQRAMVIPNGIDCDLFRPDAAAREGVRRELSLAPDTPLIGLVARYDPAKDHQNFLTAAAQAAQSGSSAHFVLAGHGIDRQNAPLAGLIDSLGLPARVHLLGERRDIPRLTAALDIAACSSVAEAFPNVVGEAMCCGIPCAVTNVGDTSWMVADTGRIVPARDPMALAAALQDLLAMPAERRRALGEAARRRALAEFSIQRVAAMYEDMYQSLVN